MSLQRYFYWLRRRGDEPEEQPARPSRPVVPRSRARAQCSFQRDPSWAAPRCCVPQTPRLAAAQAHKIVGNKIVFPAPNG